MSLRNAWLGRLGLATLAVCAAELLAPAVASADEPFYLPAGELVPGSGQGRADDTLYAPTMLYPMEHGPSYPNSQVWGVGGSDGPPGSQCDAANYSYPWRDNYCETRSWDMPLCPAGVGHQGQDTRPATCENAVHNFVSVEPGTVTNIGSYSVYVTMPDGTRFDYLHGSNIAVSNGQVLQKGQVIGKVSNEFGGTSTTIHLHFNILQDVAGVGLVFVSPYMSMVRAYEELMGLGNQPPTGPLDAVDCESIRGWAQDPDDPEAPVAVEVWFDGEPGALGAVGVTLVADEPRADLCDAIGSCNHGFSLEIPVSLRDAKAHAVNVYAIDTEGSESVALEASPGTLECAVPPVPSGVRRRVASPEILAEWDLSPFWSLASLPAGELADIPQGIDWPAHRLVVRDQGDDSLWVIESGRKRAVDGAAAAAWQIDGSSAEVWPATSVAGVPNGPPLRAAAFLVSSVGEAVYVVDDDVCSADDPECDEGVDDGGTGVGDGGDGDGDGGGSGGGSSAGASEASAGVDDGDGGGGCGCRTKPTPVPVAVLWLAALGLATRRRARV